MPLALVAWPWLTKSGWPSTPSALAPFGLLAAPSKRSTRLLLLSATQSAPLASRGMPLGPYIWLALVARPWLTKSGWASTPSALAPFGLLVAPSKRSTRLLLLSATHSRPLVSTATPSGMDIVLALVAKFWLTKSFWPSTPSALAPFAVLAA